MPKYVDGYVVPVQKKHLSMYRRMAVLDGKIWRGSMVREFRDECVGDDLAVEFGAPFRGASSSAAKP